MLRPVCYFSLSIGLLVAAYEYNRITGISLNEIIGYRSTPGLLSHQFQACFDFLRPTTSSFGLITTYFGILYALSFLVPGYDFSGPPLRDGRVLKFKINGLKLLFLMSGLYAYLGYTGNIKWTIAYDNYGGLLFWANFIALFTSSYLYIRGKLGGHSSGKGFYEDFVMGQELIFTNIYVLDYFFFEEFVTSTWDIIAEKFGFMLVWGDLVFIPFSFTLQAWFLLHDRTFYHPLKIIGLLSLFLVGYIIFRFSNKQKHDFKKNPNGLVWGKKPCVLGGKLLISGWWGLASHINYLGDLILACSYSAPCGLFRTGSFIPWFYPTYLLILLIHRDMRDDAKCSKKYGELWDEYRSKVPYRILPLIY